tara:strand:+ start:141 stop:2912 length:2772 start_codon:yes stop_codon:yes gene_type:complete
MKKLYSIVVAFLMFFNLSLFAQDGPPWDFDGTDHGFTASNYSNIVIGDTFLTYTIVDNDGDGNGDSANPNFRNESANIDTSAGNYIAVTIQNLTGNAKLQVITTVNGSNAFTNFDGLSSNDSDFVTHYINMSSNANWSGTVDTINFRFKQGNGVNNNVFAGEVLFDHIEVVESIPATPRVDYTFDDTSDSEGFATANGVTMSQPVAGELHLEIADQSPYPKLEQTGLYSVDADTYKYIQVTLVNNSPKNKLTFVSPSGGNEFSTSDMTANSTEAQTVEVDLSVFTNWSGTQANWWFQLVENPGDGAVASAGSMDIQQILFSTESINPSSYNITFSVDMSNYPGGLGDGNVFLNGNFNGWCGECTPMSDDDGDGIWTITIELEDGDYEYKFTVNGWSSQEEFGSIGAVEGCTVTDGTYTNRSLTVAGEDMTLETVYWNLCPGETPGEVYNVTFAVDTANITVGASGMYLGGGAFGDAQGNAMTDDDGDGVYEVTLELSTDQIGVNYIFLNGPGDGGDWGAKEDLAGQECADPNNYNDRILPEFDGDTYLLHCFGECSGDGVGCSAGTCAVPDITSWSMTGDGAIFDGNNQDGVIGYQIEYSTSTFTPGDGTATVYEFDSFPHTLTGLESNTTYYFTIRSVCGDDNYSDWTDNGNDGPDAWTTTICPSSSSLPYLNDFNDPDAWTNCQTFYDNDADGNYWYYVNYADIDGAGNNVAASASWTSATGALTPDNWVIMGPIDLTDHTDALLEWKVRGIDPAWCQENYSVYVGSSNNYNDLINGSVSYNETIANGGDACGNTFADRSLDISAATGGLVYIGFRHHDTTDVFVLNVDDVSVTSSTMSNEEFTLENIDYTFNQETNILRVSSEELLSNIQIYNMLGQQVLNQDLNDSSVVLNLYDLSSSIYIVNVEGNNSKSKTFKLAIK